MFTLTTFAELCKIYPTWADLSKHLVTDGGLRIIESDDNLAIIRYTNANSSRVGVVSDFTKPYVTNFRSVVWNKTTNRPVSVAPVKASEFSETSEDVSVSEFLDGTMIQAWLEDQDPKIATRTSLYAKGTFYSARSFADLFGDVFPEGSSEFLKTVLKPNQFISFVLQHRDHKTVAPVPVNRVYVTYVGSVLEDGTVTMSSSPTDWPARLVSYAPKMYEESANLSESKNLLQQYQEGYQWQGLVFQDKLSSRRWRLRNPDYLDVRSLRGGEATDMARFLRLRKSGEVKKYLSYFREDGNCMWELEQLIRNRTADLYTAYIDMNKVKSKTMRDLPYCLRPHVYALHGEYLKLKVPILKQTVVDYVNALPVDAQLKLISSTMASAPSQ